MTAAGLLVIGLLALQCSGRLDGLLAWVLLCSISLLTCALARWFPDVSSQSIFHSEAGEVIRFWWPKLSFGRSGVSTLAPWVAILPVFQHFGHSGGPWEQHEDHVEVRSLVLYFFVGCRLFTPSGRFLSQCGGLNIPFFPGLFSVTSRLNF